MEHHNSGLVLTALFAVAAAGIGQTPAASESQAAKEVQLMALRSFLGTKIVRPEPLGSSPVGEVAPTGGTSHDVHVATLRDVVFGVDGAMLTLVVEPEARAAKPATGERQCRLLPTREVRWRADGMLLTELDAAQIAALPAHELPEQPAKGSANAAPPTTVLATALLDARMTRGKKNEQVGEGSPTLWVAPAARQLAMLTVQVHKDDHRLVPWSVLEVTTNGAQVLLDLARSAERLADAPKVKSASSAPSATERAECCKHFGVAPPAWEGKAGNAGSAAKK